MPHLEDWSVVANPDATPYTPPERISTCLRGLCADHPLYPERHGRVTTSRLVMLDVKERRAKTLSGSDYTLGEPDPVWIEWLKERGTPLETYELRGRVELNAAEEPVTIPP